MTVVGECIVSSIVQSTPSGPQRVCDVNLGSFRETDGFRGKCVLFFKLSHFTVERLGRSVLACYWNLFELLVSYEH